MPGRRVSSCTRQTGPAWLFTEPEGGWRINVPLRRRDNIEALWMALAEGIVDVVGSDHVVGWEPASYEEMYNPNIWDCRTGFSRVELFLPVLLSEGVNKGRITMERLVQVSCENPARTAGLWGQKGSLLPGFDADMVIVDAGREVTVGKEHINTRSGWSIMEGHDFTGWPVKTILRGKITAEWADDSPGMRPVGDPRGLYVPRPLPGRGPGARGDQPGAAPPSSPHARRRLRAPRLLQGDTAVHRRSGRSESWRSGTTCSATRIGRCSRPPGGVAAPATGNVRR